MPRGGPRNPNAGTKLTRRTDMLDKPRNVPVATGPSEVYGQSTALREAQQQVPMARPSPPDLDAPTARPDEPITAGMPFGPGPGPEAIGMNPTRTTEDELRALIRRYPLPGLLEDLEDLDDGVLPL